LKKFNFALATAIITFIMFSSQQINSQMRFGAGTMSCNIDGDTITFALNTDLNSLYFMANGGLAEIGLIKIQWDEVKTPAEIKIQTLKLEKGFVENQKEKISIIWADFYTQMPYIINSGTLSVTENDGSTLKGTLEMKVELGGSSVINEMFKGKKESTLKNGYFEIKY